MVSQGPLIRVEGQPVSIRCDVKEYGGPREQVSSPASSFLVLMFCNVNNLFFDQSFNDPRGNKDCA